MIITELPAARVDRLQIVEAVLFWSVSLAAQLAVCVRQRQKQWPRASTTLHLPLYTFALTFVAGAPLGRQAHSCFAHTRTYTHTHTHQQ
jgi:hypothetical protein